MDDLFNVKETDQHCLHIGFHLTSFFWMRWVTWLPLTWLLLAFWNICVALWLIACNNFIEEVWIDFECVLYFLRHAWTWRSLLFPSEKAGHKLCCHSLHSEVNRQDKPDKSSNWSIVLCRSSFMKLWILCCLQFEQLRDDGDEVDHCY